MTRSGRPSIASAHRWGWAVSDLQKDVELVRFAMRFETFEFREAFERIAAALNAQLPVRAVEYGSREHADKLSAEIAELRETLEKANDAYAQGVTAGRSEALNAQAGVVEALEWIARVNATEAEYQKVARAALAAIKEKDRG